MIVLNSYWFRLVHEMACPSIENKEFDSDLTLREDDDIGHFIRTLFRAILSSVIGENDSNLVLSTLEILSCEEEEDSSV